MEDFTTAVTSAAERMRAPLLVVICPPSSDAQDEEHRRERAETALADRLNGLRGVHVLTADELLATYQVANLR